MDECIVLTNIFREFSYFFWQQIKTGFHNNKKIFFRKKTQPKNYKAYLLYSVANWWTVIKKNFSRPDIICYVLKETVNSHDKKGGDYFIHFFFRKVRFIKFIVWFVHILKYMTSQWKKGAVESFDIFPDNLHTKETTRYIVKFEEF